jgi:hypothetical protein
MQTIKIGIINYVDLSMLNNVLKNIFIYSALLSYALSINNRL